jgi:hypothetical protein
MSGVWDADRALEELGRRTQQLARWQETELSESDTRAKIIDVLLKDVLGWDEGAIRRETRSTGSEGEGYVDYAFTSEHNHFLIEAKKSGAYFEMPVGTRMRARSDGIVTRSRRLAQAIEQARSYCLNQGVPVGVVSNGVQFAAVLVHQPPSQGHDVLLFTGLAAIRENFLLFWNALSPLGHAQTELEKALALRVLRDPPQFSRRVLDDVARRDESISRNAVDAQLRPHIQRYFSDIVDAGKESVLRECFCDTPRQQQYEKQLQALIAEPPALIDRPVHPVETRRRSAGRFGDDFKQAAQTGPAVFLLVGGVGAGKTSFLHRFFRFILDDQAREKTIWLYVDFTRVPSEEYDAETFATAELLRELRDKYAESMKLEDFETLQRVYESQIARMRRGPWAPLYRHDRIEYEKKIGQFLEEQVRDEDKHLQALIGYLRRSGYAVCLALDNADQLTSEYQRQAILVSFQKARVYQAVVLMSLREETYWRHRSLEPLDAYQSPVYYINPPTLQELLSKRLQMLRREHGDEPVDLASSTGVRVSGIKLSEFMGIIVDSFLSDDRANLTTLEALAARNMRRALDMFGTFLSSGHTNTDEYIRTYMRKGSYVVPNHALIRSLALGDRRYYDSQRSYIANLYSVVDDGFYSHFNKLRVLRYLHERIHLESPVGQGFVRIAQMAWHLAPVCASEDRLLTIIDPLLHNLLLEADTGARVSGSDAAYVRLTVAGAYYLTSLHYRFAYLDQVSTDTPISRRDMYERLIEAEQSVNEPGLNIYKRMIRRVGRASIFLDYLRAAATAEREYLAGLPAGQAVWTPDLDQLYQHFLDESNVVLTGAARAAGVSVDQEQLDL